MRKASSIFFRTDPYDLHLRALNLVSSSSPSFLHQTHAQILTTGLWRKSVLTCKLINCYGLISDLHSARKLFDTIPIPNSRHLNCAIKAHLAAGDVRSGIDLYFLSVPLSNAMTFSLLLRGFTDMGCFKSGLLLHTHIVILGSEPDLHLGTDLVRFCLRSGRLVNARKVFDLMAERDLVLWVAMVDGLMRNGSHGEALCFFSRMRASGIRANAAAWNAVIAGFARLGNEPMAALHLWQMQEDGVCPDEATLCTILSLLSRSGAALRSGAAVHGFAFRRRLVEHVFVATALVDMYGKSGRLSLARRLFELAEEKDAGLWNSMILAFAIHGQANQALQLLPEMQLGRLKPNSITFTAVLSACNHAGLVDEGRRVFRSMVSDHGITPSSEHLSCMVDLLRRAGRLGEAFELIAASGELSFVSSVGSPICGKQEIVVSCGVDLSCGQSAATSNSVAKAEKQVEVVSNGLSAAAVNVLAKVEKHEEVVSDGAKQLSCGQLEVEKEAEVVYDDAGRLSRGQLTGPAGKQEEDVSDDAGHLSRGQFAAASCVLGEAEKQEEVVSSIIGELSCGQLVAISNILAEAGKWEEVAGVRLRIRNSKLKKMTACSWIEVAGQVHAFKVFDDSHPEKNLVFAVLKQLDANLSAARSDVDRAADGPTKSTSN